MDAPWFIFTCHKAKAQTMLMGWRSLWSQTMHLITCESFVKLVNRVFDCVNAFWLAILKFCLMLMLHCFFFTCWYVLILCKSLHVMRFWWDLIESSTPCSKSFEKRIGMGWSKNVQTNWGTVASNNMASYGLKPTCSPTCYAEPFLLGGIARPKTSVWVFFHMFELMVPWPFQESSWTRRMFKESEP